MIGAASSCVRLQSYLVAETRMPSAQGFDFGGSSQSFNTLAGYLFGKVCSPSCVYQTRVPDPHTQGYQCILDKGLKKGRMILPQSLP